MANNPLRALRRLLPNPPVEDDPRRPLRLMSPGYAGSDLATQLDEQEPPPVPQVNPLRTPFPQQDVTPEPGTLEYEQARAGAMQVEAGARPQRSLSSSDRDYQSRLGEYEPKDEGWGKTALRMGIGFAVGGPAGAAMPLLNRKGADQRWKARELSQSVGLEQEQAQTDAIRNPLRQGRAPIFRTRTDEKGNKIRQRVDPETGAATDETGPDGKPVMEQLAPSVRPLAERRPVRQADEQGNEYWADAGTGEPLKDAKGGVRYVKRASAKGEADRSGGAPIVRRQADGSYKMVYEPPEKPGASPEFSNKQIQTNIDELLTIKAKVKDALTSTAEFLPTSTAGVDTPNPIYRDLKAQETAADNEIRDLRLKLKGPGGAAGGGSGRTMSAANLARYAKDHGMTVEQAKASPELRGVTIRK